MSVIIRNSFFQTMKHLRIDPGISNIVFTLNTIGVKTMQSCEGHPDWGLRYAWVRIVAQDRNALESYLEAFYQSRPVLYDRMLMIEHLLDDEYMLRSHGALLQESRDTYLRNTKIYEYRAEMEAFATFLRAVQH